MNREVRAILASCDDPDGYEVPHGDWAAFPHAELAASVVAVQQALRDGLALSLDRDAQVQDAQFHDELRILHPTAFRPYGVISRFAEIAVRFSNFGRLFTVYSNLPQIPSKYPVLQIRDVVERHGWTYVAPEDLREPYDGVNEALRGGRITWWIRFFDYL